MTPRRTPEMFDRWAATYDDMIEYSKSSFPFAGYDQLIDRIAQLCSPKPGMKILDLGIGTGELAKRFVEYGCEIYGMDFSGQMLELAARKVPTATLVQGDIGSEWPSELQLKFDRIVSAYTIHHFDTNEKIDIIRRIIDQHLMEKGVLILGDISFRTSAERSQYRKKLGPEWDDSEFYWAADIIQTMMRGTGVIIAYEQVSWCGGIYIIVSAEDL